MSHYYRLRRQLADVGPEPPPPIGVCQRPLWQARPIALHRLLLAAYADGGGAVGSFDDWFWPLVEDAEFDPELVLIAADADGTPIGLAQCWTGGYVKDLVVAPGHRDRGIGGWLLQSAFCHLKARGLGHVDLKVQSDNLAARRFYARHGMEPVVAP